MQPKTDNLKAAMQSHASVLNYQAQFAENFADFTARLETLLIEPMETLNISQTQQQLAELIREKVQAMPLLDFYTAYQKLDDLWRADAAGIAADLEMIQTEGKQAIKQVDPFMVLKKDSKTKKEAEVQDGWVGHILPFELVQAVKLPQELANLKAKESRLAEIAARDAKHFGKPSAKKKKPALPSMKKATALSMPKFPKPCNKNWKPTA